MTSREEQIVPSSAHSQGREMTTLTPVGQQACKGVTTARSARLATPTQAFEVVTS